jgi:tetratricopeptide (TPR) repeat protein
MGVVSLNDDDDLAFFPPFMMGEMVDGQMVIHQVKTADDMAVDDRMAAAAAVLLPRGHPGWLWDRPALVRWCTGSEADLPRNSDGAPTSLVRMAQIGAIAFGPEPWPATTVTVFQRTGRDWIEPWMEGRGTPPPGGTARGGSAELNQLRALLIAELAADTPEDFGDAAIRAANAAHLIWQIPPGQAADLEPRAYASAVFMAVYLGEHGRPSDAVELLGDILVNTIVAFGGDHPAVVETQRKLNTLVSKAIEQSGGIVPGSPEAAGQRAQFALALAEAGKSAEAAEELRVVLADLNRLLGPDHKDVLTVRSNFATLLARAGQTSEALEHQRELLAARIRVLGPEHPHTLISRNNLSTALARAGNISEAIELGRPLLADRIRILGPDHIDTLTSRNNLAVWTGDAGDMAGAVAQLKELLADQTRILGANHPLTAQTRESLANFQAKLGP